MNQDVCPNCEVPGALVIPRSQLRLDCEEPPEPGAPRVLRGIGFDFDGQPEPEACPHCGAYQLQFGRSVVSFVDNVNIEEMKLRSWVDVFCHHRDLDSTITSVVDAWTSHEPLPPFDGETRQRCVRAVTAYLRAQARKQEGRGSPTTESDSELR